MEIKMNKDIREYKESIFFGLSMRQTFFSALACSAAVVCYFVLKPYLGVELTSWVCILAALPCAVLGFITYNGMPAERFLLAWFRSQVLMPRHLTFRAENLYENLCIKKTGQKKQGKDHRKEISLEELERMVREMDENTMLYVTFDKEGEEKAHD